MSENSRKLKSLKNYNLSTPQVPQTELGSQGVSVSAAESVAESQQSLGGQLSQSDNNTKQSHFSFKPNILNSRPRSKKTMDANGSESANGSANNGSANNGFANESMQKTKLKNKLKREAKHQSRYHMVTDGGLFAQGPAVMSSSSSSRKYSSGPSKSTAFQTTTTTVDMHQDFKDNQSSRSSSSDSDSENSQDEMDGFIVQDDVNAFTTAKAMHKAWRPISFHTASTATATNKATATAAGNVKNEEIHVAVKVEPGLEADEGNAVKHSSHDEMQVEDEASLSSENAINEMNSMDTDTDAIHIDKDTSQNNMKYDSKYGHLNSNIFAHRLLLEQDDLQSKLLFFQLPNILPISSFTAAQTTTATSASSLHIQTEIPSSALPQQQQQQPTQKTSAFAPELASGPIGSLQIMKSGRMVLSFTQPPASNPSTASQPQPQTPNLNQHTLLLHSSPSRPHAQEFVCVMRTSASPPQGENSVDGDGVQGGGDGEFVVLGEVCDRIIATPDISSLLRR